ncbi:hypothetical protein [Candidatus Lokiarchaeum ossiferum]|uniref:hypothetical protein n=1 Tax=Candidatus Lokiarchaeum ossiferum TaxID=2951803 RepID=UPI00352E1CE6
MESNLFILLFCTGLKIITLLCISGYLFFNWLHQEKRYYSDFPFLNAITFIIYAIGKGIDMYVYVKYQNVSNLNEIYTQDIYIEILFRIRFIVSPILVVLPYLILMTIIWLNEKPRLRVILSSLWFIVSITLVMVAKTYAHMLLINQIVAFPVIILSIISFAILHYNKRFPQINSLLLSIGWFLFAVSQFLRNFWQDLGSGVWGLTWIGELIEFGTLIIIGLGFIIPAFYSNNKDT